MAEHACKHCFTELIKHTHICNILQLYLRACSLPVKKYYNS